VPKPEIVVLGTIRAPRLGILTVVQNTSADAWQIQLRQESGKEGALMSIALDPVTGRVIHTKHDEFENQQASTIILGGPIGNS